MPKCYRSYCTTIVHWLCSVMLLWVWPVLANDLAQQREQFSRANEALQRKDLETFQQLTNSLTTYPLYYYLRYQYLKPRLTQVPAAEIDEFLKLYGQSAFGNSLRQAWLEDLATQRDWPTFVRAYTPQKSIALQCYYIQARLATGQSSPAALQDAKTLWLTDKSQPSACHEAFEYLYNSSLINDELLWQRIQMAMAKGQLKIANTVAQRLSLSQQLWFTRWQAMHQNPAATLNNFNEPDLPVVRDILLHGLKQLAKQQFDLAISYWEAYQRRYAFSLEQIGEMQRELAVASVKQEHPQALRWLTAVHRKFLNPQFNEIRLQFAFARQHWEAIEDFISEMSEAEQQELRWRYWLARALEQNGKTKAARQLYQTLAQERDYYGFLAADKIKVSYQLQNMPILFTPLDQAQLLKNFSIAAAYEFYQQGWLKEGRQEWQYAIEHLPPSQQVIAAALAHRWGWHSQAILTASKANALDDLEVRFPLAFYSNLAVASKNQGIDLAWVYGIIRQESVFMEDARSRAGALGLMQLMPATARLVAKQLGLSLKSKEDILEVDTNLSLGTSYLQQMLDRFDGNYLLATAAYNAGPGRAKRWAEENPCIPADLWVEMIPFEETRTYVRRVLFYTRVFEARLQQPTRPLRVILPSQGCSYQYSEKVANRSG